MRTSRWCRGLCGGAVRGAAATLLLASCGGLSPSDETLAKIGAGGASANAGARSEAGDGASAGTGAGGSLESGTGGPDGAGTGEPSDPGGSDAGPPEPPVGEPVDASASDDIFGQAIPRSDSWWVEGTRIHLGDREVTLRGISWFGLDSTALALFGPKESGREVSDFLSQLKELGFNALRVPLAPESINPGHPSMAWVQRGDLDTGHEHFLELADAARDAGLYMLWDVHTCAAAVGHLSGSPTDPECTGYGKEPWIADLRALAALAQDYAPYVLGIDLFNEPYDLAYEEWRALAIEGGRAVLEDNPRLLVFVEGVGGKGYLGTTGVFYGENLTGIAIWPIDLPASRLVYSPHVYGPGVFAQDYFASPDFPANMPAIWDEHFGYLFADRAVVPGEFGGFYTGDDRVWQDAFVEYLVAKDAPGFFYWCLNPNSGDTGGLLLDGWRNVNMDKLSLLAPLLQ
jgi:endoglucanase